MSQFFGSITWRWRLACLLTYMAATLAATGRTISLLGLMLWCVMGLSLAIWTGIGYADQTYEEYDEED